MLYFLKFPLVDTLGGAEFHTLRLAEHFRATGHEIKLITSDHKLFRLFEQHHLPRRRMFIGWEPTAKWSLFLWPLTFLIARHKLGTILRKNYEQSDTIVFFCQGLIEKLILPPLFSKEGLGEFKVLFLEHKIPHGWLKLNPLKLLYLRRAKQAQIITVSNFAKQEFIKLGVPESSIKVIYPAVHNPSTSPYLKGSVPPLKVTRLPARQGGGARLAEDGESRREGKLFTIGVLSRLDPEKGVLELLKNLLPYLPSHPNWQVLIAGEGEQKSEIEKLAQKNSQIQLLGFVYDLDKFFSQISVLVYPSLVPESFGLAALEAQSRGIPVMASNLGALPEVIKHAETGYLIPSPGDGHSASSSWSREEGQGEIASWIGHLEKLQNPKLYKKMNAAALAHAQNFSETKIFEEFDKLI